MYQLVNDVAAYPDFLPWCKSSKVISESEVEMTGSIEIAHGALNKTFTTRNILTPYQRIELELVDGPFKQLNGYWMFESMKTENACKISFHLEFEFASAMISIVAKPVFSNIAGSMVDAFCKRATEVYGERD